MQLVIDIGNTSTSLALMRGERVGRVLRIEASVQTATTICAMLRQAVGANIPVSVGIASVVPLLNPLWEGAVQEVFHCSPIFVDYRSPLGIKITYPHPETIGADRLANAAGAVRRYGAPVIVADFGTAVTFDLVTPRDGYMGGVIAPGLPLMFDYLADRTAKLPRIRWAPVRHRVGKSTVEAMQLGAHWGYRGMVREIFSELRKIPALRSATLCATGGFARKVLRGVNPAPLVDPTLTLYGVGCMLNTLRGKPS